MKRIITIIILSLFIISAAEEIEFSGKNIKITKLKDGYRYFISSGVIESELNYTVSGNDITIIVDQKNNYKFSTAKKVIYEKKEEHYLAVSNGISYDSAKNRGKLFAPVKVSNPDGVLNTKEDIDIIGEALHSNGKFTYQGKDQIFGSGENFSYDGSTIIVKKNGYFKNKDIEFYSDDATYKIKEHILKINKNGIAKLKDGDLIFKNGIYSFNNGRLRGNNFSFTGKIKLIGNDFDGILTDGKLQKFNIENEPKIYIDKAEITGDRIKGNEEFAYVIGNPKIDIINDTFLITLYPEDLRYDITKGNSYCKGKILGEDSDNNIYFGRDLTLYKDSHFVIEKNFSMYNNDMLISAKKVIGDSTNFTLLNDGYLYYDKDQSEIFFERAYIPDIKKKYVKSPSILLIKKDEFAKAENVEIKEEKSEKRVIGEKLKFYSKKNSVFIKSDRFKLDNDIMVFPEKAVIYQTKSKLTTDFDTSTMKIDQRIDVEKGYYDSKEKKLVGSGIRTKQDQWYIRSKIVDIVENSTLYLKDAIVTTCELDVPHYHFFVKNLKIIKDDKLMFKNAFLYIGNLPILYLPFYIRDINPDNGPLVTYIGRDAYRGYFVKNVYTIRPKFLGIRPILKLFLDYMTETDIGSGFNFDYKLKTGNGRLFYYFNRDWNNLFIRNSSYRDISKIRGNINQNVQDFKIIGTIDKSNSTFINKYFSEFEQVVNQKEFVNQITVTKNFKKYLYFSLGYRERKYIYDTGATVDKTLPDVRLNMKTQDLKIIRISANSSYYIKNNIDRGGLGTNIGFKSLNAHYFTLTTQINFNAAYTTSTLNDKIECFAYMPLSASLLSSAYRIFDLGSIKLKHTISPIISFSYNEPLFIPDSENFIVGNYLSYFETATKGLGFSLNNRFSLKDSKGKIKNIGQLNLSGNYNFKLKKIPAINGYATFIPLNLNLRAGYSFLTEKITSCSLGFNKTFPNGFSIYSSLSYYTQFVQTMRLNYKYKNLTLMTNLSYNYYGQDIMKRFNKRELSLNFPLHCFNLRFLYQLQYYGDLPTLNKFLFTISIGKMSGSDLKIESDFKNRVLSILGNREPMPM